MAISGTTATGVAGLDSNSFLKVNEFPSFRNKINYYVDNKYSLLYSDGSKLRPYITITDALNAIGADTGVT